MSDIFQNTRHIFLGRRNAGFRAGKTGVNEYSPPHGLRDVYRAGGHRYPLFCFAWKAAINLGRKLGILRDNFYICALARTNLFAGRFPLPSGKDVKKPGKAAEETKMKTT